LEGFEDAKYDFEAKLQKPIVVCIDGKNYITDKSVCLFREANMFVLVDEVES
jgi:hypothetical protein